MGGGSSLFGRTGKNSLLLELNKNKNREGDILVDFILGKGGYSTVYHGTIVSTNREVAIKQMNIKKLINQSNGNENLQINSLNSIFAELNAFKRIQQQNSFSEDFIVTLYSASYSKGSCYFVMSCCEGGDLRRYLRQNGPLSEESVVCVVGCIGSALHFLHCQGVIHRDVKPENIGLDMRGRPYLMDFGISVISTTENPLPICYTSSGTREYLAPEVLAPRHSHSYQSDFWSLGVMAHEMLLGHRPFSPHHYGESVKFVANEYGWMWDKLKNIDPKTISPSHDFHSLYRCSDDEYWVLPFPDVASKLQLDENGNAPPSLIVNIPESFQPIFPYNCNSNCNAIKTASVVTQYSTATRQISNECRRLITGLLDVRIPDRLGSIPRYSDFSDHDCFVLHNYFPLSSLGSCESPLSPKRIDVPENPKRTFLLQGHSHNHSSSSFDWEPALYSIPSDIIQQLMKFSYQIAKEKQAQTTSRSPTQTRQSKYSLDDH